MGARAGRARGGDAPGRGLDGNRLAICNGKTRSVHIYDFNRTSGTPTLFLDTGNISSNQDVEFSPDGKLIYYCYSVGPLPDGSGNGFYGIRQMEIATQQIRTLRAPAGIGLPFDLQLGPDDKLYIARPGQSSLDVVTFPNTFNSSASSNDCGYFANAVSLVAGVTVNVNGALPNAVSMCADSVPQASLTYTQTA